ncbi:hypothetical protein, partial [Mesorhizobium sp. M1E.F.Ca.ET.041.01.1.1]|uniref:hypothetical protein n=1 Tax=Mesorhizobium sp. M1E.F.Ca.ET.041.01.1.1 TaxID=2496759 RepID=UPI001AECF545
RMTKPAVAQANMELFERRRGEKTASFFRLYANRVLDRHVQDGLATSRCKVRYPAQRRPCDGVEQKASSRP